MLWHTLVGAGVAGVAPDPEGLAAAWARDAAAVGRHGDAPAALSTADFAALAAGEVVAHRVDTPEGAFATGAVWVPVPIEPAWVTVQDQGHRPLGRAAAEERLPDEVPGRRRVYLRLALPWPVADRQWVAELTNNRELFVATGGHVWQRRWKLADPELARHADDEAVWVEENRGAWTLLPVDGGTLCVIAVRSVVGGTLPPEITDAWAVKSLKGMLRDLAELAPGTAAHYRAGHEPVLAPDGTPVAPQS